MSNPPLPSLLAQPTFPPRTLDKNHTRFGFVSRNKVPSLVLIYERHPEWFVPLLFLRNNSPLANARNAAFAEHPLGGMSHIVPVSFRDCAISTIAQHPAGIRIVDKGLEIPSGYIIPYGDRGAREWVVNGSLQ